MRVLYVSLLVVLLDQTTKLIVKGIAIPFLGINLPGMHYAESINVIGDFFKITFVENPGMAFGIDIATNSKLLLALFALGASIAIIYYLFKIKDQQFNVRLALALVLGGAIGNLIDRTFYGVIYDYAPLFYGNVVDFFNVDFFDFTIFGKTYDRWPIFNIADAAVSVGVVMLILFQRDKADQDEEEDGEDSEELSTLTEETQNLDSEESNNTQQTDNGEDNNRETAKV